MKKVMLLLIANLIIVCFPIKTYAQDALEDPIKEFKYFEEISITTSLNRINTRYASFDTELGSFDFEKNRLIPTGDVYFYWGWLYTDNTFEDVYTLKTGLGILNRSANFRDSLDNKFQLSTGYLQIPVQFGMRSPIRYQKPGSRFFKAIEWGAGVYVASPIMQRVAGRNDIDGKFEALGFNYLRYGLIAEIAFTALDKKGHGHKFGIRSASDFAGITKFKETDHELYPYYYTLGIFYNLSNDYYKKGE